MTPLTDLLRRVEGATGPDRELDKEVWLQLVPGTTRMKHGFTHKATGQWCELDDTRDENGRLVTVPSYTAGADAMMDLIERDPAPHGRKIILYAGGQLMAGEEDDPRAKADNSVTTGWVAHVAFYKDDGGTFGPDNRWSHGSTRGLALAEAYIRALIARQGSSQSCAGALLMGGAAKVGG